MLRHYDKATVVLRQVERMGAAAQQHGQFVDTRILSRLLMGQLRATMPPGLAAA